MSPPEFSGRNECSTACDVRIAPLNAARTAQRAIPTHAKVFQLFFSFQAMFIIELS
jgi:hypothetical protein